jgi:hypothetical protein
MASSAASILLPHKPTKQNRKNLVALLALFENVPDLGYLSSSSSDDDLDQNFVAREVYCLLPGDYAAAEHEVPADRVTDSLILPTNSGSRTKPINCAPREMMRRIKAQSLTPIAEISSLSNDGDAEDRRP